MSETPAFPPLMDWSKPVEDVKQAHAEVEVKAPWLAPEQPDFTTPVELPYSTEGLQPEQIEILTVWEQTKAQLSKLKEYEMQLRKVIVYDGGFFSADKTSGIERATLGGGYSLAATKKETYNLDSDKVEEALTHFTESEADLLVKWSATLSVSNYKKLPAEKQAFFNDCLEIKIGAPTLEIKPPKDKS